ncbi:MAG: disulfide bond formation protein B [Pseudomonadota bacterium]
MSVSRRAVFLGFFALSVGALGVAYGFQFAGLKPCALCLYQRLPYGLAAGIALLAFLFRPEARAASGLCLVLALLFLGNAGLASYHVGVEQGWFTLSAACAGGGESESLEMLRQSLRATEPARCDEVPWALFGISIAGFNALASLALAASALWAARILRKGSNP